MILYPYECSAKGLDHSKVSRIARRLERAAKEAKKLGLTVFGGNGSGDLRINSVDEKGPIICALIDGPWAGGDGQAMLDEDGLSRGVTTR